ncbi:MAG: hypothetical protein WCO78_03470 [Candidatus Roizmanbacteria bacterium]
MSEFNEQHESTPHQEYTLSEHNEFVQGRTDNLAKRAGRVFGTTLMGTGLTFALAGIGDFVTGGEVSRTLNQLTISTAPEILTWAAHHLAQVSQILKLTGGSAMTLTGKAIVNRLS